MARPVRVQQSANGHFRQRIPTDILPHVRGTTIVLPIGDARVPYRVSPSTTQIKVSLRATDPATIRERHGAVLAYLERFYGGLRAGPVSLTHKQMVALSGDVYRAWVTALEDDPKGPDLWRGVLERNRAARKNALPKPGAGLMIGLPPHDMESVFGAHVDWVLAKHGLKVDPESYARLLLQVAKALDDAAERLLANASGDYGPDTVMARFPVFVPSSPPTSSSPSSASLKQAFDAWAKEMRPGQSTRDQWWRHVEDFQACTGCNQVAAVTREDALKWKTALLERGDSPKTVRDSKLAALKTILNHAVANGTASANPFEKVTVPTRRKAGQRMLGFSNEQAAAILEAASRETRPTTRWIPYLCALTGGRMAEVAQLRREDVVKENEVWTVTFTAEAGSLKNEGSERKVPLHPFLVDTGFTQFVEKARPGPLFYDPRRRSKAAKKPPAKIVAKNVAAWVHGLEVGVGRDQRVDPNHGWRHWFRTAARDVGILDSVVDAIEGHAARSVGHNYGGVWLSTTRAAIARIPVPGQP